MRPLLLDDTAQCRAIEHVDDVTAVGHLHRRRMVITVDGNHLAAEALEFDDHLAAELTGTAEQHTGG